MMAGIRSTNTRPELAIRKALHAAGFRYRLHPRDVPGKPDMAFARYRAAVFVNGCFWHGHDCPLFRLPDTRRDFWTAKIERNRQRDAEVRQQLHEGRLARADGVGMRHPGQGRARPRQRHCRRIGMAARRHRQPGIQGRSQWRLLTSLTG